MLRHNFLLKREREGGGIDKVDAIQVAGKNSEEQKKKNFCQRGGKGQGGKVGDKELRSTEDGVFGKNCRVEIKGEVTRVDQG